MLNLKVVRNNGDIESHSYHEAYWGALSRVITIMRDGEEEYNIKLNPDDGAYLLSGGDTVTILSRHVCK